MKKQFAGILFVLVCAGTFGSCTKKTTNSTPANSMKATVGNTSFAAVSVAVTKNNAGGTNLVDIAGVKDASNTLSLILSGYTGAAGTYTIDNMGTTSNEAIVETNGATVTAAHGSIVVTSVGSSTMSGTFSFTCTDSTKVTGGTFTCPLP
jgi:hypothetical protein